MHATAYIINRSTICCPTSTCSTSNCKATCTVSHVWLAPTICQQIQFTIALPIMVCIGVLTPKQIGSSHEPKAITSLRVGLTTIWSMATFFVRWANGQMERRCYLCLSIRMPCILNLNSHIVKLLKAYSDCVSEAGFLIEFMGLVALPMP